MSFSYHALIDSPVKKRYNLDQISKVVGPKLFVGRRLEGDINGVHDPVICLGKKPDGNIRWTNRVLSVSKRHALLYYEEGRVLIEDLGSTNGTIIRRVDNLFVLSPEKKFELKPGDEIYFGFRDYDKMSILSDEPMDESSYGPYGPVGYVYNRKV